MKNFQRIISSMHRAIDDYNLIEDGDKITVGISGGKDSLCLLKALATYQKFADKKFEIIAITIDLFNGQYKFTNLSEFCKELNIEHHIIKTDISQIIFEERKEKSPCSLCANMRRGVLNSTAKELGCNKVALGHHLDDLIETFFLSMIYEGRLNTFQPITYLSKTDIYVIRPFLYVDEQQIIEEKDNLPVFKNPCPVDHKTQREEIKNLLKEINLKFKNSKKNIANSLIKPERYNLLDKYKKNIKN